MSDLVAFLRARVDEDEAAAEKNRGWMRFEAKPGDWTRLMYDPILGPFGGQTATRDVATGMYVGKMSDPARVLREVEAKRAIVDAYQEAEAGGPGSESAYSRGHADGMRTALLIAAISLARIWRDHPDFDPAWASEPD